MMYETQRLARTIALMSSIYKTQHHTEKYLEIVNYHRLLVLQLAYISASYRRQSNGATKGLNTDFVFTTHTRIRQTYVCGMC